MEINGTEYIVQVVSSSDEEATKINDETTTEQESGREQPLKSSYYASVETQSFSIVQESFNSNSVIQLPVTTISVQSSASKPSLFVSTINSPSASGKNVSTLRCCLDN